MALLNWTLDSSSGCGTRISSFDVLDHGFSGFDFGSRDAGGKECVDLGLRIAYGLVEPIHLRHCRGCGESFEQGQTLGWLARFWTLSMSRMAFFTPPSSGELASWIIGGEGVIEAILLSIGEGVETAQQQAPVRPSLVRFQAAAPVLCLGDPLPDRGEHLVVELH